MFNLNNIELIDHDPLSLNVSEDNNIDFNVYPKQLSPNDVLSDKVCNSSLLVSHINVRSLRKNFDSLQELYEDVFKNKFHFIGLSEVWNVKDTDEFRIPDYNKSPKLYLIWTILNLEEMIILI